MRAEHDAYIEALSAADFQEALQFTANNLTEAEENEHKRYFASRLLAIAANLLAEPNSNAPKDAT